MSNNLPIALTRLLGHIPTLNSVRKKLTHKHYAACWVTLNDQYTYIDTISLNRGRDTPPCVSPWCLYSVPGSRLPTRWSRENSMYIDVVKSVINYGKSTIEPNAIFRCYPDTFI